MFSKLQTSERERNNVAMQAHVARHLDMKATYNSHYLLCPTDAWIGRSCSCAAVCNCQYNRSIRSLCKAVVIHLHVTGYGEGFCSCFGSSSCRRYVCLSCRLQNEDRQLKRERLQMKAHMVLPKKEDMGCT